MDVVFPYCLIGSDMNIVEFLHFRFSQTLTRWVESGLVSKATTTMWDNGVDVVWAGCPFSSWCHATESCDLRRWSDFYVYKWYHTTAVMRVCLFHAQEVCIIWPSIVCHFHLYCATGLSFRIYPYDHETDRVCLSFFVFSFCGWVLSKELDAGSLLGWVDGRFSWHIGWCRKSWGDAARDFCRSTQLIDSMDPLLFERLYMYY